MGRKIPEIRQTAPATFRFALDENWHVGDCYAIFTGVDDNGDLFHKRHKLPKRRVYQQVAILSFIGREEIKPVRVEMVMS